MFLKGFYAWTARSHSLRLIASGDPALMQIIGLSLRVTLTAVLIACLIGLPLGAAWRWRGFRAAAR
jgi:ABC-type tungstate transport system substrate-binding protein